MFSLVQAIIFAEAGLMASAAATVKQFHSFLPGRTMQPKFKITENQKSSR